MSVSKAMTEAVQMIRARPFSSARLMRCGMAAREMRNGARTLTANTLSQSASLVSAASERVLGWSTGAHGLRHSYAQERMAELQASLSRDAALTTVSQEMGHFRPEITETYLR